MEKRQLDAQIACNLFGWSQIEFTEVYHSSETKVSGIDPRWAEAHGRGRDVPKFEVKRYSADHAAAAEVRAEVSTWPEERQVRFVDELWNSVQKRLERDELEAWEVIVFHEPVDVCIAALRALGHNYF